MARKMPVTIVPMRSPPSASGLMIPTTTGMSDRDERGQEHLLDRRARDDVDRAAVVRPARSLEDPRDLAELAAHLVHHLAADAADRLHGQRGEEEGHEPADEEAGDHPRVVEREDARDVLLGEPARVLVEEDEGREAGRADRVALRDRLRRVPHRIERVGDAAHRLVQVGHLGDAAGVVGHRPVGVERDDEPGHRELGHDGDADAVEAVPGDLVGGDDPDRDHDHRQRRRLHPDGEALDDVRRVAGLRRPRRSTSPAPARARVVLGDRHERERDDEADQGAERYSSPKVKAPSSKARVTGMKPIAESTVATTTAL